MKKVCGAVLTLFIVMSAMNVSVYSQSQGTDAVSTEIFVQPKSRMSEEYRQYKFQRMREAYLKQMRAYNQSAVQVQNALTVSEYPHRFGMNMFGWNTGFGLSSLYSKRLRQGLYFQTLLGFANFYSRNPALLLSQQSSQYGHYNVMVMPLFFGLQKEVLRKHMPRRIYPFVQAGIGPVLGANFPEWNEFFSPFLRAQYRLTPGAMSGMGLFIGITPKYWIKLDAKYNLILFNKEVGFTRNYSGPSFSIGFSRGFFW